MSRKKIIQNIGLALLLIGLPATSWWFLSSGYNFFKTQMAELGDYGKVPAFEFYSQNGDTLTEADLKGKIVVSDFIFTRCAMECAEMSTQMARVQDAFKDNPDVMILSHTVDPDYDTPEVLKEYSKKFGATKDKWYFLTGDRTELYKQAREGYKLAADEGDSKEDFIHSPHFVLIDTSSTIRNYYDGTDSMQVNRMIVHISMIMPRKKEAEVKYKPENEM